VYIDLDWARDAELDGALAVARKADGVVFDVRGYPLVDYGFLRYLADRERVTDVYSEVITRRPDRREVALEAGKWPPARPAPAGRSKKSRS
jgi:hypothetical protein